VSNLSADVVVIGAGVAGLAASRRLTRAGLNVALIEARERVGGRALTTHTASGLPVELGAEFIHGKPPFLDQLLAKAHLKKHAVEGEFWRVEGGRWSRGDEMIEEEEELLEKMNPGRSDLSFAEYLRRDRKIPARIRPWLTRYVEGFHAADPERISVRALVEGSKSSGEIEGDKPFRLLEGYSAFAEFLLNSSRQKNLQLLLGSPVDTVEWRRGKIVVASARKRIDARCAVVTLPLSLLQSGAVRFSPSLEAKSAALNKLAMGPVIRITLEFQDRFWAGRKSSGGHSLGKLSFLLSQDQVFPTWWTYFPKRDPLITGWAASHYALQPSGRTPQEICEYAIGALGRLFKIPADELQRELVSYHVHDWQSDRWSCGAYSYACVGGANAFEQLARPLASTLFFAGEATSHDHNGTVHGALDSGHRAGEEVLHIFEEEKKMASQKQSAAARRNIKKAASAARRKRTISHLSKRTRTALGKEGAKAARRRRHHS
jgi:monoamine oxidase